MTAVARFTVLEITRRRLLVSLVLIAVLLVAVIGLSPLFTPGLRTETQRATFALNSMSGVLGLYLLVSGFAVGMTVVYNDLESGAAVSIFVKPLSRLEYTVGKTAAVIIVLAILAATLSVVSTILLLANGGTSYDYGAVVTNFLAGAANTLILVLLIMALSTVMNNIVAGIFGFVLYELFSGLSSLHTLVVNHVLTAEPWAGIVKVVYWLVPHSLFSSLPREIVRVATLGATPRPGARFNPYAGVPSPSGVGDILFWAAYCVVIVLVLYLAVRRRQV
ncbi:MAG: hypothetical protein J2P28_14270 [Actinobacteria bacterium]|nr:hypothetical protein [Actinomycetota bacterium]